MRNLLHKHKHALFQVSKYIYIYLMFLFYGLSLYKLYKGLYCFVSPGESQTDLGFSTCTQLYKSGVCPLSDCESGIWGFCEPASGNSHVYIRFMTGYMGWGTSNGCSGFKMALLGFRSEQKGRGCKPL